VLISPTPVEPSAVRLIRLTLRAKGWRVTRGIAGEPTRAIVAEFGLERASESFTLEVSEVASFQFVGFESPAALA
jgi:hypothetical protein